MTVFLTTGTTDDTRTAFPAADFLRMRVMHRRTQAEVANSFGANASYIFRDTDFYLDPAHAEEESPTARSRRRNSVTAAN